MSIIKNILYNIFKTCNYIKKKQGKPSKSERLGYLKLTFRFNDSEYVLIYSQDHLDKCIGYSEVDLNKGSLIKRWSGTLLHSMEYYFFIYIYRVSSLNNVVQVYIISVLQVLTTTTQGYPK